MRRSAWVLVLLAGSLALSCTAGGGGFESSDPGDDGGALPGGLQATFTAADPSPDAMSLSLAPGASSDAAFEVRVLVTDVDQFFGAAFRIVFDASTVDYHGFSTSDSFILAGRASTDFRVEPDAADPGVLLINATRQGQLAGIDANGSELLLTLAFEATGTTAGNSFSFDTPASRQVVSCPQPPAACTEYPDYQLNWSGGTLTAN